MDEIIIDSMPTNMPTKDISVSDTCCTCLKETSGALTCKKCRQRIHTFCHASRDDEMDIFSTLCFKSKNAIDVKINSKINMEIQTKKRKLIWKILLLDESGEQYICNCDE